MFPNDGCGQTNKSPLIENEGTLATFYVSYFVACSRLRDSALSSTKQNLGTGWAKSRACMAAGADGRKYARIYAPRVTDYDTHAQWVVGTESERASEGERESERRGEGAGEREIGTLCNVSDCGRCRCCAAI